MDVATYVPSHRASASAPRSTASVHTRLLPGSAVDDDDAGAPCLWLSGFPGLGAVGEEMPERECLVLETVL